MASLAAQVPVHEALALGISPEVQWEDYKKRDFVLAAEREALDIRVERGLVVVQPELEVERKQPEQELGLAQEEQPELAQAVEPVSGPIVASPSSRPARETLAQALGSSQVLSKGYLSHLRPVHSSQTQHAARLFEVVESDSHQNPSQSR